MNDTNIIESSIIASETERESPIDDAGAIKFYGLFWKKNCCNYKSNNTQLLGQPHGWLGGGLLPRGFDYESIQINFSGQKGVYILYDANLMPVYVGQAGLVRKSKRDENIGRTLGARLYDHYRGSFRNGWHYFSWFGFLDLKKIDLRGKLDNDARLNPNFNPFEDKKNTLNNTLSAFEAVLIEGFSPRFNAKGGNLGKAILVDQYERDLER